MLGAPNVKQTCDHKRTRGSRSQSDVEIWRSASIFASEFKLHGALYFPGFAKERGQQEARKNARMLSRVQQTKSKAHARCSEAIFALDFALP